jgi:hypothetical protein
MALALRLYSVRNKKKLTVSLCESPIFLPESLLVQSSPPLLDMMPGTTRGMLNVFVVVKVRVCFESRWRIV